jgi:hypothetical protein
MFLYQALTVMSDLAMCRRAWLSVGYVLRGTVIKWLLVRFDYSARGYARIYCSMKGLISAYTMHINLKIVEFLQR